jgi:flavin reductase (DIM6/NTAB) family NADH-FMN oxidoreductase RutF
MSLEENATLNAYQLPADVDPTAFKLGMRRLVASVCLITAGRRETGRVGLTATAVCSVCAEPATLLSCVNRASASYARILEENAFAVNVLPFAEAGLADRFASNLPSKEKFRAGRWIQSGSPLLETALVNFDCEISQHVEVGTHAILFGRVRHIRLRGDDQNPLLYAQGAYGGFSPLHSMRRAD